MVFHILNGESTANVFTKTGIGGDYISWREDLMTGSTPQTPTGNRDAWLASRAEQLSDAFNLDLEKCRTELALQERKLEESLAADEIVLWFEYDLFCQINLIYLLNWYGQRPERLPRLSLPADVPILEKGLGTLEPDDLKSLFLERKQVSADLLRIGSDVWKAYTSKEPTDLAGMLNADASELPFLRRSLQCHLSRFPSLDNGLGRVENLALDLIASGKGRFGELFPAFWFGEGGAYGYGDAHFRIAIMRLVTCREPILKAHFPDSSSRENGAFMGEVFELTEAGRAVLAGRADHIELNGIDQWLGGVHLTSNSHWRWDEHRLMVNSVRS